MSPDDLLPLLLAGHLVGDWVPQTDFQATSKTTSWKANQQHMASYHLVLAALAALAVPLATVAVIVAVSWVTHSVIDRRWPVVALMRLCRKGPFAEVPWGVIVVDQALHLSILCLLAAGLS